MQELYKYVLLLVAIGMLIGVGILTFDRFGIAVKEDANIVNETIAIAGRSGTTTNDDVTAVTYFGNSTYNCAPANSACVNFTTAGAITANSTFANASYQISYTYDRDSTGTTVLSSMATAVSPIASTWLPLITTVLVLAIILTMVIASFGNQRK